MEEKTRGIQQPLSGWAIVFQTVENRPKCSHERVRFVKNAELG